MAGCKSGLVYHVTCLKPPRIVRLKFQYAESSKAFFEALLERYKLRFGEPDEWRGDLFGIVLA